MKLRDLSTTVDQGCILRTVVIDAPLEDFLQGGQLLNGSAGMNM